MPVTSDIDRIVSLNIRKRRLAAGMTIKDVAIALGISNQMIVKIERGDVRIQPDKMLTISNLFSCSIDDLFDGAANEYEKISADFIPGFRLLVRSVAIIEDQQALSALLAIAKALADASIAAREATAVLARAEAGKLDALREYGVEDVAAQPDPVPMLSDDRVRAALKSKRVNSTGKTRKTPER